MKIIMCCVCVEGHMLKERRRVTRLEYACIPGNKNKCTHIKDETLNEGLRRGRDLSKQHYLPSWRL
jgi:hypothetical protein